MIVRGAVLTALAAVAVLAPAGTANAAPSPLDPLVSAATQRLQTADPVAAVKWITHGDIEDPARVQQVLTAVTATAGGHDVDADYVTRIFTDQIHATEAVEYRRFSEWKLDPAAAPTAAPDLSSSRARIDALNTTIVTELGAQRDLLRSPACPAALRDALDNAGATFGLDPDYRQALAFATHSYCG
ncbi:gamma subclass chorismate mutase AroQ [Mycolicibacterium cosmeticum]|uniref:Chorismate mutase n=1 Tax=Mycolicibacterium cosmeticum TaxID=258533 RepID=W9AZE5_MYCCO|nr:chorismate mutase [Mycolicibacterium cosmeticum]TLH71933.1 gamma subclass chorismate mutase AroQ [Mycolicibacterium cosmeticum]CDO08297.1 chorismate mutase [Mycolicibacterium cosmeticum]